MHPVNILRTFAFSLVLLKAFRESTFIMPRGWGGGGVKILRGAPKYFLALKGGTESSRYTEGGAVNFSKFWSSRGLECSLPP
jgi:hypothetical protein